MEPSQESSSDEELNIASDKFNPLKALYSDKFKVPVKDVKIFDNVTTFMSRLEKAGNSLDADLSEPLKRNVPTNKKDQKTEQDVDEEKFHVTAAGRRFLKEQAPIHRGPKAKFSSNIFKKMESMKGPISLLNKFKLNRTRVKIYVRKEHGIRGYITGMVEAFDKHFNIALVDCLEVWKRRKFKFSDIKVPLLGKPQDCSHLLKSMGFKIPEIKTKSLNRKTVECTRQISQLMIRGEEVILVCEDTDLVTAKPSVN